MKMLSELRLAAVIISLLALSCEEQELEVDKLDPFVNIKLINNDSLSQLNDSLETISTLVTNINDSIDTLEILNDGGDNTDYRDIIEQMEDEKLTLDSNKRVLTAITKVITSGKVRIVKLSGNGGEEDKFYNDSLTAYTFPLNVNADQSQFYITIDDETYSITFSYTRDTVRKEGAAKIDAYNIKLTNYTFDSVKFPCDTLNCTSNEATATLYF